MENYGFFRVAAAIPKLQVADCEFNIQQIIKLITEANTQGVQIVCFPELSISSYTCGDLFLQKILIEETEKALTELLEKTQVLPICFIVGVPVEYNSKLYNCAVVCQYGKIRGIVPKTYLPNYSEFYEKRWFESCMGNEPAVITYANTAVSFGTNLLFNLSTGCITFAIEICEDLWAVVPPSSCHAMAGAQLIFNLSASNELIGKQQYVKSLIAQQSARCHAAYVYASSGFGESTTDLVYAGNAYIYENGKLLAESMRFQFSEQLIVSDIDCDLLSFEKRRNTSFVAKPATDNYKYIPVHQRLDTEFSKLNRTVNPAPFIPLEGNYNESCEEIFSIQVAGLAKRIICTDAQSLIVGVSGGLDSTLALLVCAKAVDKLGLSREMICGVTMPGFGTSNRTYRNALCLMQTLKISIREINILAACEQHFKDIGHNTDIHNVTYENTQARERTQILMDLANQLKGIVIGTGDMSELALGWATYNGDHMSMYGVNVGVPKTLVRHLVGWVADTHLDKSDKIVLSDIINTPISPELLPADTQKRMTQFTEDVVGPYELHDFFLYYTLRYGFAPGKIYFLAQYAFADTYSNDTVLKWLKVFYRRFFNNQFKRNCMPDGPKIGSVNLSPRGDWRMPSDASVNLWLREINSLL